MGKAARRLEWREEQLSGEPLPDHNLWWGDRMVAHVYFKTYCGRWGAAAEHRCGAALPPDEEPPNGWATLEEAKAAALAALLKRYPRARTFRAAALPLQAAG